jgi:hypothetical protein
MKEKDDQPAPPPSSPEQNQPPAQPACQLCGGRLIDIRGKLQCERCHTIWETCCEGGRW